MTDAELEQLALRVKELEAWREQLQQAGKVPSASGYVPPKPTGAAPAGYVPPKPDVKGKDESEDYEKTTSKK